MLVQILLTSGGVAKCGKNGLLGTTPEVRGITALCHVVANETEGVARGIGA